MRRRMRAAICVTAAAALAFISLQISRLPVSRVSLVSSVEAGEDAPSGGGYGCKSNGNCQGTVYKDKSNLDRWWYPVCSGCHTPQSGAPANPNAPLSPAQRQFVGNAKAFWALHAQAQQDPVLRSLLPKSKLKPVQMLSPEFRALVGK